MLMGVKNILTLKMRDQCFLETGLEDSQVRANIARLKLTEDSDFKTLTGEWNKKKEAHIQQLQAQFASMSQNK